MNGDLTEPIHDLEAERYTLSAMMTHPSAIAAAVEILTPDSFYRPAHRVLFRAMVIMQAAGERVDPVTLRAWLEQDGDTHILGAQGALYLADLFGLHATPASVGHYAAIVLRCAWRRAVWDTGQALMQDADRADLDDAQMLAGSYQRLDALRGTGQPSSLEMRDLTAGEVCDREDEAFPVPVIPGLLDPMDRTIVVGPEGSGKTMLAWQVGFALAAGCHPFALNPIPPRQVLVVDLENPPQIIARRWRMLRERARWYPGWDEKRDASGITLLHRPGGLDLTSPRDAYGLTQLVARREPALVIAGPIYKMISGVGGDDKLAAYDRLAAFYDRLRARFGCAIWLEAHAPFGGQGKREMRPEGSNLWAKWPEFGLSLNWATKAHEGDDGGLDVSQFRGHRDEGRPWPLWLTRNHSAGGWPWTANYARGVLTATPPPEDGQ